VPTTGRHSPPRPDGSDHPAALRRTWWTRPGPHHHHIGISPGSRAEAARPDRIPVALLNGEELVGLLVEHEIGVARRGLDLLEFDDNPVEPAE
jgi:hypothetical protein